MIEKQEKHYAAFLDGPQHHAACACAVVQVMDKWIDLPFFTSLLECSTIRPL